MSRIDYKGFDLIYTKACNKARYIVTNRKGRKIRFTDLEKAFSYMDARAEREAKSIS